jgi:hypothetical protein
MKLKYLKAYENYSMNENESEQAETTGSIKNKIQALSDSQKKEISENLRKLSNRLGLSIEEMQDQEKVAKALAKEHGFKSDIEELVDSEANEGFKDAFNRIKNYIKTPKFNKILMRLGILGTFAGLVISGAGMEMQSATHSMPSWASQDPNLAVIIGGVAAVISAAAAVVGASRTLKPEKGGRTRSGIHGF